MTKAEFDQFAREYRVLHERSVAFSGCETEYFAAYKVECAAAHFRYFCSQNDCVLDFGCGTGVSVPHFRRHLGATKLVCADVSSNSLDVLHQRFGASVECVQINTDVISVPSNSIGMVFSSCVFHHIDSSQHVAWLRELHRVTRPEGIIILFEHNPINPLTRHAVNLCAFDKNAVLLSASELRSKLSSAGWSELRTRYHVFFPGFLRALRPLEAGLGWLALGGQYSVIAIKRQG